MEGDASDKNIAFMLQDDVADGPYYRQDWEGMPQTTPNHLWWHERLASASILREPWDTRM